MPTTNHFWTRELRVWKDPAADPEDDQVTSPIQTYGLTHIALAVRDPQQSLRFYQTILGAVPVYESDDFVQVQTPGTHDVLVFERKPGAAGRPGGVVHFGFRLQRADDIGQAVSVIQSAGGVIRDRGEFVPGEPCVFFTDPDGYEVEIWYELPTPLDLKPRVARAKTSRRGRSRQRR